MTAPPNIIEHYRQRGFVFLPQGRVTNLNFCDCQIAEILQDLVRQLGATLESDQVKRCPIKGPDGLKLCLDYYELASDDPRLVNGTAQFFKPGLKIKGPFTLYCRDHNLNEADLKKIMDHFRLQPQTSQEPLESKMASMNLG